MTSSTTAPRPRGRPRKVAVAPQEAAKPVEQVSAGKPAPARRKVAVAPQEAAKPVEQVSPGPPLPAPVSREEALRLFQRDLMEKFPDGRGDKARNMVLRAVETLERLKRPVRLEELWREVALSGSRFNYDNFRVRVPAAPEVLVHRGFVGLAKWYGSSGQ